MNIDSNQVEALLNRYETELQNMKSLSIYFARNKFQRLQTIVEIRVRLRELVSKISNQEDLDDVIFDAALGIGEDE